MEKIWEKVTDKGNHLISRFGLKLPSVSSMLLFIWLCEGFALAVVKFILVRVGLSEGIVREGILFVFASIALALFLFSIRMFDKKKYMPFVFLFAAIVLFFGLTAVFQPATRPFLVRLNFGIDRIFRPDSALYAFLFFSLVEDPEELKKNLRVYGYLDMLFLTVVELLPALIRGYWEDVNSSGAQIHMTYNLSFGYAMILPTILFAYFALKDKKLVLRISDILLAVFGVAVVFFHGNRGALLLVILFFGLMFLTYIKGLPNNKRKWIIIGVTAALVILLLIFGKVLLKFAATLLLDIGINSRNLRLMASGNFMSDNGRDRIWNAVIAAFKEHPVFGGGIFGDRPVVAPIHYVGYSHNILLELLASFGVFGLIPALYIIGDAVYMIFFCKEEAWRDIYIILFSVSCQLLISMSFWYVFTFWACAAIAFFRRREQDAFLVSRCYKLLKKKGCFQKKAALEGVEPSE